MNEGLSLVAIDNFDSGTVSGGEGWSSDWSFIGAISLKDFGIYSQVFGAIMAALGVFLPGTFLIFFVIRFWVVISFFDCQLLDRCWREICHGSGRRSLHNRFLAGTWDCSLGLQDNASSVLYAVAVNS